MCACRSGAQGEKKNPAKLLQVLEMHAAEIGAYWQLPHSRFSTSRTLLNPRMNTHTRAGIAQSV
jgi:hypothetical protein